MRILLLSAYHAVSHAYWADGLQRYFGDDEWTVLTLPPRHFRWRIRGNSLSWAFMQREVLERDYDLVLATSMVDMTALRGMVPALTRHPTVVYFHENQFAYPNRSSRQSTVGPQVVNLYTALVAERIVFNSAFNRDSFIEGARELLRRLPDFTPLEPVVEQLNARASVLPVPLQRGAFVPHRKYEGPLQVVWNHRWEYDKGPEYLRAIVEACNASGVQMVLHVVGQQFRDEPRAFRELRRLLGTSGCVRLGELGYVADDLRYYRLLAECDVVLSTARHDFQGLSVLEAVAAGCLPLLPDRLCYPEWFDARWLYHSAPEAPHEEAQSAAESLAALAAARRDGELPAPPDVRAFGWATLGPQYARLFDAAAMQSRR